MAEPPAEGTADPPAEPPPAPVTATAGFLSPEGTVGKVLLVALVPAKLPAPELVLAPPMLPVILDESGPDSLTCVVRPVL